MGLLDFLKKNELAEILKLKTEILQKNDELSILENRVLALSKYNNIVDAEAKASEILHLADINAKDIISKANNQANSIIKDAEDKLIELKNQQVKEKDSLNKIKTDTEHLTSQYNDAHNTYTGLKHQIDIYNDTLDIADYGVYEPHFNFDDSEKYKGEILRVREEQKNTIKNDYAALGGDGITWNGSLPQGQAMVKRQKKLMLRAFNGECDSSIANVDWNNISRFEERMTKSYEAINKVYETQGIHISTKYLDLKLKELRLAFEYKKKKYEEKEEQREIREQMREEERVSREIESAKIKAEKEEETYQKALEKARSEMQKAVGSKQDELMKQITELEARLREAETNKQRALSMAQLTKRGHVYVISNIGSFGDNIYKIGMTRRLEPMDRVKELGDASVPFSFDVHAMIFSEDAPALEFTLHKEFDNNRLNMINPRKEFFNVSLNEIEEIVVKNHGQIEFTKIAEAQEYRETLAMNKKTTLTETISNTFPNRLFV